MERGKGVMCGEVECGEGERGDVWGGEKGVMCGEGERGDV